MTAAYTSAKPALSDGLILGYLTVDFGFSDRRPYRVPQRDVRQHADGWRIVHYRVSRLD
jgi:hypothetical protein